MRPVQFGDTTVAALREALAPRDRKVYADFYTHTDNPLRGLRVKGVDSSKTPGDVVVKTGLLDITLTPENGVLKGVDLIEKAPTLWERFILGTMPGRLVGRLLYRG